MKKILALLLALSMLLCLAACAGTTTAKTEETKTETAKSDKDYEIVVVPKDASNPWFVRMDTGVKEYAAETGLNVYQKALTSSMPPSRPSLCRTSSRRVLTPSASFRLTPNPLSPFSSRPEKLASSSSRTRVPA